ncbi:MAG TPA: glycosyltransferase, partial [Candidatus Sulfotelmatobacter sp.]|nr:glycosyltransferase [Candidatus Sulfotelmatobacter sp.]
VRQRATFVLPGGGAHDSRTRSLAQGLAARGHQVTVIARRAGDVPDVETWPGGVEVRRVASAAGRGGDGPSAPAGSGFGRWLAEGRRIAGVARRADQQARAAQAVDPGADLYQTEGFLALPVGLRLAAAARAPLVYDARDIYAESNNIVRLPVPARRLFERRERGWARRAARLFTVNDACADLLAARLGVARPAVVRNCPPRWAIPTPRPDRLRETLGLTADTPVVLHHGALVPGRGIAQLAAAMRQPGLERAHLVYLGWGTGEAEVAALAADPAAGGRLHRLPPVPPEDLLPWVASADVVAVTIQPDTLNHRLSTPNKLWEALAAGVPVVASDFPAMRQVVMDDPLGSLGAVCDPTDPPAIGAALAGLLARPLAERDALRARVHQAAADRWNWEHEFATVLREYGALTGRPW